MDISAHSTIGSVVSRYYQTASVFESFHLDFCCGGKRTIEEACAKKQLDTMPVLAALAKVIDQPLQNGQMPFHEMSAQELISYILTNHHYYIKEQGPVILGHLEKVAMKHGGRFPYMRETALLFDALLSELLAHMQKEEKVLFPLIRKMAVLEESHMDTAELAEVITHPIAVMEAEHDVAGDYLHRIHALTNGFTIPPDACTTFRISLQELQTFESRMFEHVHLENNLLFPMMTNAAQSATESAS